MASAIPPSPAIRPATALDLPSVQRLADTIWHLHYPGILDVAQIDYMLALGYSDAALSKFLHDAGSGLALAAIDEQDVGFAAWYRGQAPNTTKLDKLYVLPDQHGKGIGRRLIAFVEAAARADGASTLVLNVNKDNASSIAAYRKCGFEVRESVVIDIGEGWVMDDYVMSRPVGAAAPGSLR